MGSGRKSRNRKLDESSDESLSSASDDTSDSSRRCRHRRREKERREKEERRRERVRERKRRKYRRDDEKKKKKKKRKRNYGSESESSSEDVGDSESESEPEQRPIQPQDVLQELLKEFPSAGVELEQILHMIDDRQAVDIKGISEKSLVRHLKKLFVALSLKESGDRVFSRPDEVLPTLEVVGHLFRTSPEMETEQLGRSAGLDESNPSQETENRQNTYDANVPLPAVRDNDPGPGRRVIGPAMPSAELLAAAAKLTEAQAELREAELEEDDQMFVGPPPPALVAEAASANEAERFEEVTRILSFEDDSAYEILGVNQIRTAENIKKRYWKVSLLVHPDKCSHPQANQAFIKLNKAFKELQDPDKKKALDDKLKEKEEMEKFKIELRAMREAAQWRRAQGISMEGDDELLKEEEVKVAPQREEWMTTLPPERKAGVTMQSTKAFSKGAREGRGDTSAWTDTPSDRAQKAKMNYLEAYNEAAALVSNEVRKSSDADLVDKYNKEKRSKSLVEKHREERNPTSRSKKKSVQKPEKEDWVGQHPWKPWDRETDLTAGRKSVNFDPKDMSQGISSRFSSGTFQRNFL